MPIRNWNNAIHQLLSHPGMPLCLWLYSNNAPPHEGVGDYQVNTNYQLTHNTETIADSSVLHLELETTLLKNMRTI